MTFHASTPMKRNRICLKLENELFSFIDKFIHSINSFHSFIHLVSLFVVVEFIHELRSQLASCNVMAEKKSKKNHRGAQEVEMNEMHVFHISCVSHFMCFKHSCVSHFMCFKHSCVSNIHVFQTFMCFKHSCLYLQDTILHFYV